MASNKVLLSGPVSNAYEFELSGNSGQLPTISGHGLQLRGVSNVVVSHVAIRDVKDDAIEVSGSTDVWVDRVRLSRAGDGLFDVVRGSGDVTLSGSHLFDHDKAVLIGSSDAHTGDSKTRVSILGVTFGPNIGMRLPSVRYATVESRNNLRTGWTGGTAIDLRKGARLDSCGDIWIVDVHNRTKVSVNSGAVFTECGR